MNNKKPAIKRGLVFDGLLFKTPNAYARRKGAVTANKRRWLKYYPNDFISQADMLVKAETDVTTSVIEPAIDLISAAPFPDQPDPAEAYDEPKTAQTPMQSSPLPGQRAAAKAEPDVANHRVRVPIPAQMVALGSDQTAAHETNGSSPDTTPPGAIPFSRGSRGERRSSTGKSKSAPKLSPARMVIVLDSLQQYATYALAAWKAGIHHKTLAYWLKRSKAGDDGYDLEWEGVSGRFHVLCEIAIETAENELHERILQIGLGVQHPGTEAYVVPPNIKMLELYLALKLPEKYGKRRKPKTARHNPVLVVGQPDKKREYNTAVSVKARQRKSLANKI